MIIVKDIVSLRAAGRDTSSIRFIISPAMIDALNLEPGDLVQITILKIFKHPNQTDPISIDIPMPGKVIKAGGGASLGVTVRKNIVDRLKLQENDEIIVSMELVRKHSI